MISKGGRDCPFPLTRMNTREGINGMGQTQKVGSHKTAIYTSRAYVSEFICVQYHDTVIVRFNAEKIVLDSGGWQSRTTKVRMNQASNQFNLGYQVFQKKHAWYVSFHGEITPFDDGMVLRRNAPVMTATA